MLDPTSYNGRIEVIGNPILRVDREIQPCELDQKGVCDDDTVANSAVLEQPWHPCEYLDLQRQNVKRDTINRR